MNKVLILAIIYRMYIFVFEQNYLKELNGFIVRTVQKKIKVNIKTWIKKELYIKKKEME